MFKKTFLFLLVGACNYPAAHAELGFTGTLPITITLGELPISFHISPHVLISCAGFTGCLTSLYLLTKGSLAIGQCHVDQELQKNKNKEGKNLLTYGALMVCASFVTIFHKQIFFR